MIELFIPELNAIKYSIEPELIVCAYCDNKQPENEMYKNDKDLCCETCKIEIYENEKK